uniref:(California timema) hypothetical protein n=1 Tax=Timema californicum TaxID=61474 RepID=A0A7R9P7Y2_TIMCA|nr:unnamed protein product [Timema californicum]
MVFKFVYKSCDDNNQLVQNVPSMLAVKESTLAAQVFLSADLVKEAIDAFIHAEDWNKAKRVARELEPRYNLFKTSSTF